MKNIRKYNYKNYFEVYVVNTKITAEKIFQLNKVVNSKMLLAIIDFSSRKSFLDAISNNKRTEIVDINYRNDSICLYATSETVINLIGNSINEIESVFVADICDDAKEDYVINSIYSIASKLVKNDLSNISIEIKMEEYELIFSYRKKLFDKKEQIQKLKNIF